MHEKAPVQGLFHVRGVPVGPGKAYLLLMHLLFLIF
jgi:hypothetical protein